LRAGTQHRGLALSHFLLAVLACLAIYMFPAARWWPILLPALLFGVRVFVDRPMFHYGLVDGLLGGFLITALIGCWAAYDQKTAWLKLCLLIAGILLYYAISTQPEANLGTLAGFWFIFGVAVSLYFLLTLDFVASPAKFHLINQIGLKWMFIRPAVSWPAIQPTDTAAGIAIITSVFGLYFLAPNAEAAVHKFVRVLVLIGFGVVAAAVLLATSRGALVALMLASGVFVTWMVIWRMGSRKGMVYKFFPGGVLLLIGVTALLLISPLGGRGTGFFIGEHLIVNRSELIRNGIALMMDFPFLGGGLGSFPGLFSQYILVIPFFSLLNSHNLFVDVSIEQGMIGGLAFLILYSIGLWKIASILGRQHSTRMQIFYGSVFTSIFVAMVHGLVDDYLYSSWSTALVFFPLGMSMLAVGTEFVPVLASNSGGEVAERARRSGALLPSRSIPLLFTGILIVGILLTWNKIAAEWFANLGAVEMAKVELAGYPANEWEDGGQLNDLLAAKMLFIRSLAYDAGNRIANHRLGLIEMTERNFSSAVKHLTNAYRLELSHRGIIKNLGYSYAWLGEMNRASLYLRNIPEANSEMDAYVWWWDIHGRRDLSTNASNLASAMKRTTNEP
jgi:hypothetical protein